jgi:hypothetical protein
MYRSDLLILAFTQASPVIIGLMFHQASSSFGSLAGAE